MVELDVHPNGKLLQNYIGEQTGRKTVPNIIVDRVSRGGSDTFQLMETDGKLLENMQTWGYGKFTIEKSEPKDI